MAKVTVKCQYCFKEFTKRSDKIKKTVYCSRECFSKSRNVEVECAMCGKKFIRLKSLIRKAICCGMACTREYTSMRMTFMNSEINAERMTLETRQKLREARLGRGEGKTYTKTFGVHTHRIVAEEMLGRKLKKGEVVHHIDENKRNNVVSNLMIFSSQKEHAQWHAKMKKK